MPARHGAGSTGQGVGIRIVCSWPCRRAMTRLWREEKTRGRARPLQGETRHRASIGHAVAVIVVGEAARGGGLRTRGWRAADSPFRSTSPLPGASTSPRRFRNDGSRARRDAHGGLRKAPGLGGRAALSACAVKSGQAPGTETARRGGAARADPEASTFPQRGGSGGRGRGTRGRGGLRRAGARRAQLPPVPLGDSALREALRGGFYRAGVESPHWRRLQAARHCVAGAERVLAGAGLDAYRVAAFLIGPTRLAVR